MEEGQHLLGELALVAAVAVAAMLIAHRARLPAFGGLLVGGAIAGPHGFALVPNTAEINQLAEVGVILLLFSIGLEFSVSRLRYIWRAVAIGGALQMGLTMGAAVLVMLAFGDSVQRGILFGGALALSSTAIVLRALSDRGELDAPHGRFIVGILIFQDIAVVPLTLIVPLMSGVGGESFLGDVALTLLRGLALAVIAIVLARLAIPGFLRLVAATKSREVFLLAVLSVGIGAAWLMSALGLSVALGAFVAGMLLADTEFRHRAMGELMPLRDAFGSIFFISLGLLFDGRALLERPGVAALILIGLVVGKAAVATVSAIAMRYPARAAWLAGASLAQFGEFGFVVLLIGLAEGLATAAEIRLIVTVGVLSMLLSRVAIAAAPRLRAGERLLRPLEQLLRVRGVDELAEDAPGLHDHVVVVGYGVAGRLLCAALRLADREYVVLELDVDRVRDGRAAGEPIYYGDITSPEVLRYVDVPQARAVILLINDPEGLRRALGAARSLTANARLIARTRYVRDRAELLRLGADEVVCEELEAGAEIAAQVLMALGLEGRAARRAVVAALADGDGAALTGIRQAWLGALIERDADGV
ncbi:MAG: cation:proton antiporter [Chloroflexi bacterium]|nr:cation:proton antiporter [Chloroflexota bacterium]